MASRKHTIRKAGRAAKVKSPRIQGNTPKTKVAKNSEPGDITKPTEPRRSARVAARLITNDSSKHAKRFRDGSQFVQILRSEKELPRTLATLKRMSRIQLLEGIADGINPFAGLTRTEVAELMRKLRTVPQREKQKIYEKAYETGIDRVLANTFGYRYESARDDANHVWFWDQALGSWRYWIISGTGRVHESFHLTPPLLVASAWEEHLKLCGHPSLDLRAQPAFHWTKDDSIKVVAMPITIVTDRETWLSTEYLKSQLIDDAVSKHFRIPVDDIIDPCLIVEHSQVVPRLRIGMPLYDPFTPLGFLEYHDSTDSHIQDDDDEDGDDNTYETPALVDIATHLRVALPAQPSPLPVVRSSRSPKSKRRTASSLNSPSWLP